MVSDYLYSHLKLHIYPDGGVARFKVYGEVKVDWTQYSSDDRIDLASATIGARSVCCNDMFFSHMDNLIMPGRGVNMGDGWETKRNRTLGNRDWIVVQLATVGTLQQALIDTCHFKGNYPDTCSIDALMLEDGIEITNENIDTFDWIEVLPKQKLRAHHEHYFDLNTTAAFSHVRLNIYPDGGISRMRIFGQMLAV
jgi:allantoicase